MPDPGMFEFSKHRDIQREARERSFCQEAGYCRDLADAFEGQPEEGLLIHLAQAFERLGESTLGKVRDPF